MNNYEVVKKRVYDKLDRLDSLRPFPAHLVQKLREQFSFEMNYNSNAIEGNSLTLRETILVLQEGITIKNKPLKDHLEAKNQAEAIKYLYEVVSNKIPITEHLIRTIQTLVVQNIDTTEAGSYRNYNVRISGSSHVPPEGYEVSSQMKDLLVWYRKNEEKMDVLEFATRFKHKFVAIHPFGDGNGRTSRLLMNIIFMQAGLPIVVILKNDRQKYYRALQKADNGSIDDLLFFVARTVERSLDVYLKTLQPSTKDSHLLPVSLLASQTPYSAEYISMLVRRGLVEGVKEGRNWKTSLRAVNDYIENRKRKR